MGRKKWPHSDLDCSPGYEKDILKSYGPVENQFPALWRKVMDAAMNPVPDPSTKFYLAVNGQAQGPHSAAVVLNLWQQKTIEANTLICAEGGEAWVTLKEMEPVLRAVAPPVAPAGYGGVRTPGTAPRAVQQVVILKNSDSTKGLRLGTLLAALVLFFLPWLELKCAGQRLMYQTGIQTILKDASMDGDMEMFAKTSGGDYAGKMNDVDGGEFGRKTGPSLLAGGALLCVVIAFAVTLGSTGRAASGIMAALALALLGVQAGMGFPLQSSFEKEMEQLNQSGFRPGDAVMPGAGEETMAEMFAVKFSPWFYGELGLLAAAAVMALSGGGARRP